MQTSHLILYLQYITHWILHLLFATVHSVTAVDKIVIPNHPPHISFSLSYYYPPSCEPPLWIFFSRGEATLHCQALSSKRVRWHVGKLRLHKSPRAPAATCT